MARPSETVIQSTMTKVVRQLAALRRREDSRLHGAMLDLAAALIDAVELKVDRPGNLIVADDGQSALDEWAEQCAALLTAIVGSLRNSNGAEGKTLRDGERGSLLEAANRLLDTSRASNDTLSRLANEIRTESANLVRRVGEVGRLSRLNQREQLHLAEDLRKVVSLENELARITAERRPVVERMQRLQERLHLANAKVDEQRTFEQRVRDVEKMSATAEHTITKLQTELNGQQQRLTAMKEQEANLPRQIAKTRALIADLEASPNRGLFLKIEEIWKQLPLDQID